MQEAAINYYERHIGDYLKDTAHLSLLEHGIYTRLLDVYYTRECAIPDDQVARLIGARSSDEREALQAVLAEFFQRTDAGWIQARCEREIARFKDKQDKARRSADARWSAHRPQSDGNANAYANARRTHSEGNALQSPVTSNQTPDVLETSAGKRRKRLPADFYPDATGVSVAERAGLSLGAELQRFRDHHSAKGTVMLDWQAAFRTWVNNAQRFSGGARQSAQAKTISDLTGGLASVKGGGHALRIA